MRTTFVARVDPELAVALHAEAGELGRAVQNRHPLHRPFPQRDLAPATQLDGVEVGHRDDLGR